jgi:hypothetical protein
MDDVLKLLLGGRTPEQVVSDESARMERDAALGTVYGLDIVHEKHFTHEALSPVPVAFTRLPEKVLEEQPTQYDEPLETSDRQMAFESRINGMLEDIENHPELAQALDDALADARAAVKNPLAFDPGTSPELLALFAQNPFLLSRFVGADHLDTSRAPDPSDFF